MVIITCEHGGNTIPAAYSSYFAKYASFLQSHRGWDPGALSVAKLMAVRMQAPLHYSEVSRLLIELNRSLHHLYLFSFITRGLSIKEKHQIVATYYTPYRQAVEEAIEKVIVQEEVIHLSIHSFTPVLKGKVREAEIGLLFDPKRAGEKSLCHNWKRELLESSDLRIKLNYPYLGTADGFTTYLRKKFPANYIGIEVEINQALLPAREAEIANLLTSTFHTAGSLVKV